jgi:hypothetical protein
MGVPIPERLVADSVSILDKAVGELEPVHGGVLLAGLQERHEDGVGVLKVIVHDVDKETGIHEARDEGARA